MMSQFTGNPPEAVILDLDGTLYDQRRVQWEMMWRLLRAHWWCPTEGIATVRALRAYRNAQEFMRTGEFDGQDISMAQVALAGKWTGLERDYVGSKVARWMELEPLDAVRRSTRKGAFEFLACARGRGAKLGIFSDYRAVEKLVAMGLSDFFDVVVSAQDAEVQRFKPDPQGIEVTLRRLGTKKDRTIYIGDRPDVDVAAAAKAGIPCIIISPRRKPAPPATPYGQVTGYDELRELVFGGVQGSE